MMQLSPPMFLSSLLLLALIAPINASLQLMYNGDASCAHAYGLYLKTFDLTCGGSAGVCQFEDLTEIDMVATFEARNEFPNDIRVTTKICAGANQSPCRFVSMKTRVDACDYIAGGQYYGAECPAAASQYTASGSITVPYGTEERFEETGYEYDRYYLKFEFRPSGNDSGGTYCQVPLHVYVADGSYRFWSYSSLGAVVALVGLATYGAKKRKLSTASDIPIDREEAIETEFVGSSL